MDLAIEHKPIGADRQALRLDRELQSSLFPFRGLQLDMLLAFKRTGMRPFQEFATSNKAAPTIAVCKIIINSMLPYNLLKAAVRGRVPLLLKKT